MVKPKYKLYTPGPVDVPGEILKEMSSGLVYHREESFTAILRSIQKGLQRVIGTTGDIHVLTSSGTGGMEAAVANTVTHGDKVVVATAGKFGERWREICLRYGAYVDEMARPYGESIPPAELERRLLANDSARVVFTTLTETSTGALHDIKAFGDICHRLNRVLVVDAIAGLGADELRMDEWRVGIVVGGAQKGLAVPPGVAFLAVSPRAWEQVEKVKSPRFYFDLRQSRRFNEKGQTPWTPAISLFYALDLSLKRLNKIGMTRYWKEHGKVADMVRSKVAELGLTLFPHNPSNALTVIRMPDGVDGTKIVDRCKRVDKLLLANGQAEMRGKVVRIGHMGPVKKTEMEKVFASFRRSFLAVKGRGK